MDYSDMVAEADQAQVDNYMERQHRAGAHDIEPDEDCWMCQEDEED